MAGVALLTVWLQAHAQRGFCRQIKRYGHMPITCQNKGGNISWALWKNEWVTMYIYPLHSPH